MGTTCAKLGDDAQGEEVLRLAVQYAQDGSAASKIFARLGKMFLEAGRHGEAIGPLRRAEALGADKADVLPDLASAFVQRDRYVAAWAYLLEAEDEGVSKVLLETSRKAIEAKNADSDFFLSLKVSYPGPADRALAAGEAAAKRPTSLFPTTAPFCTKKKLSKQKSIGTSPATVALQI